jgi:hypothetical protein
LSRRRYMRSARQDLDDEAVDALAAAVKEALHA